MPTKKKTKKPATRKQAPAAPAAAKPDTALVLRCCAADMTSYGDFRWPEGGKVKAPDWQPTKECGHGLHGFLWGEGDGKLLNWAVDNKWLVVEVEASTVIDLEGKVKFPRGEVVFCGDRLGATSYIQARRPGAIVGGTSTSGDRGTSTSGDRGILNIRWWDGKRYRIATFYVGEDGIEPNQPYRVDEQGRPVKVQKSTASAA